MAPFSVTYSAILDDDVIRVNVARPLHPCEALRLAESINRLALPLASREQSIKRCENGGTYVGDCARVADLVEVRIETYPDDVADEPSEDPSRP